VVSERYVPKDPVDVVCSAEGQAELAKFNEPIRVDDVIAQLQKRITSLEEALSSIHEVRHSNKMTLVFIIEREYRKLLPKGVIK